MVNKRGIHMSVTPRDNAVFEAGIKLGALYHQFVGAPVSLKTAESLEKAIAQSISVQPFVKSIKVHIDRKMVRESLSSFGYTELKGPMMKVDAVIKYENYEVSVGMAFKDQYPLMYIKNVKEV
jgi:dihydroneopterin aldolase